MSEKIKLLFSLLINSKLHTFPKHGTLKNLVTSRHGIYVIYGKNKKPLYVGRTIYNIGGLQNRLYSHLTNGSTFSNNYLNNKVINLRKNAKFQLIVVNSLRVRAYLEAYAIGVLCPTYIGYGKRIKNK